MRPERKWFNPEHVRSYSLRFKPGKSMWFLCQRSRLASSLLSIDIQKGL